MSILDIGAGSGTYSDLLRVELPDAVWSAVEIHEPYLERFGLADKYDMVIVADARTVPLIAADVVILGDVLEHMGLPDALALWGKARRLARLAVFLSLPIIEYPQGASEGNEHETHRHTWSHDAVMTQLSGIVGYATFTEIGVYQAAPCS